MNLWNKLKQNFEKSSKQLASTTEDLLEKSKKIGDEGWDSIKEIISEIGDKASDISAVVKLKLKTDSLHSNFKSESIVLGKLVHNLYNTGESEKKIKQFNEQVNIMLNLEKEINNSNHEYSQIRKTLSDGYVVNRLKNDLTDSGIIIEQVMVSENSNVVNKYLKDLLLPKEALVSAIKRDKEVIIPDGNTKFLSSDVVTVLGKDEDVSKIIKRFSAS